MRELLKKSLDFANKNIVLACALVIFSIVTSVYLAVSQSLAGGVMSQSLVLYMLAAIAFFSGFFNQITALLKGDGAKMKFLEGVGEYFLPMSGICLISLVLYGFTGVLSSIITVKIYGGIEAVMAAMNKMLAVVQTGGAEAASIDNATLQIVLTMLLILWAFWGLLSFVLLYWVPVLYLEGKRNIFISLISALKFLFKNFGKSLLIFVIAVFFVAVISILSAVASSIVLLEVIFSMLNYYVAVVFIFAVFIFFKKQIEARED